MKRSKTTEQVVVIAVGAVLGGAERFAAEDAARRAAAGGARVVVLANSVTAALFVEAGLEVQPLELPALRLKNLFKLPAAALRLRRALANFPNAHIITHSLRSLGFLRLAAALPKRARHTHHAHDDTLPRGFAWLFSRCSRVLACSKYIRQFLKNRGVRGDIGIFCAAGDITRLNGTPPPPRNKGAPVFGFLSRPAPWKGGQDFAAAARMVQKKFPNARFLAFSSDTCDPLLPAPVEMRPPKADIRQLLAGVDVVVCPSRRAEPFGRVIAEALATRRPAVGPNIGGATEMLARFPQLMFTPKNTAELARAMLHAAQHPPPARDMLAAVRGFFF